MGTTTTFTDLIAAPASEKIFLAELRLAEHIENWTLVGGKTYTYSVSYLNETITLADSSTEILRKSVVRLEENGTALTARASLVDVEANSGSYWHDTANSLLYVHPSGDDSPTGYTMVAFFWLYFATKGIILNSIYYEPYIAENGIPVLSQRVPDIHWGVSDIGAGALVLLNGLGFFDQIAHKFIWTNKLCKLLLGGDSLAYAEYTTIFTGKIIDKIFTQQSLTLNLRSMAFDLLRQLPINNFWTTTWANLDPAAEGLPIPYYWGNYNAAQASIVTCINTAYAASTYQFKICDTTYHAINSITQVYVDYGGGVGWQTIAHANEDLANATFTINTASFVVGISQVKVAFQGYHSGGTLIDGAPEIVEDILLNQCGYVAGDLDSTSFTNSKAASLCTLNVPVESDISAISIIEQICKSDLAFFDENGAGALRYRTWEPLATGSIPVLDSTDILQIPEISDDISRLFWKAKIGYGYLCSIHQYLFAEASDNPSRYKYEKKEVLLHHTYLRSSSDAAILGARLKLLLRDPTAMIRLPLKASQITKNLGDTVKITLGRAPFVTAGGFNERIFEIVGKDLSCFPLQLILLCRDLADYGSNVGVWMGSTAPNWSVATEQEREDSGFWCDSSGYADPADPPSLNKSLWW